MKIGFAIMLDHASHNYIRSTQLKLHQEIGIGLARQTPHITIKSPFDIEQLEPYIAYVDRLAASLQPFDIVLRGFGSFGEKILFLDVEENAALTHLHHRILGEMQEEFGTVPHEFEGENVKFHASIAGFSSAKEFQESQSLLHEEMPRFSFQTKTLGIFYYLGEGNGWIVNRRVSIG